MFHPARAVDLLCRVGRLATRDRVRFISATIVVLSLVVAVVFFATSDSGTSIFGPALGADFGAFYMAGKIVTSEDAARLYDLDLQIQWDRTLFPKAPKGTLVAYPLGPFMTLLFAPLSQLPYNIAFMIWLLLGMAGYICGFHLLWKTPPHLPEDWDRLAMLVAVAFIPFILETWIGGQTGWLAYLCICASLYLEARHRSLLAGAILACCLYKPTLLALVLPMLLVTRSWATLAGFTLGGAGLACVSLAMVGSEGCQGYIELLLSYGEKSHSQPDFFPLWKFVDAPSCLRLFFTRALFTNIPVWLWMVLGAACLTVIARLVWLWGRAKPGWSGGFQFAWASALIWTPVLSPHFGIYDTVLIVPALVLLTRMRPDVNNGPDPLWRGVLVFVFVTPAVTQVFAIFAGMQVYSLVMSGIGLWICLAPNGFHLGVDSGGDRQ